MQNSTMSAMPVARRGRAGIALILAVVACVGCQAAVPNDWAGMKSIREEQKILKLAKRDPFPSPADVGLDSPTTVP